MTLTLTKTILYKTKHLSIFNQIGKFDYKVVEL